MSDDQSRVKARDRRCQFAFVAIALSMFISSCAGIPGTSRGSEKMAVSGGRHMMDEAFKSRDLAALGQRVSEHVSVTGPVFRTVGRDDLKSALLHLTAHRPDVEWTHLPDDIRVYAGWQVAFESGSWRETWRVPDGATEITGRYAALWVKSGTDWVLDAEVFVPLSCTGSDYCRPQ